MPSRALQEASRCRQERSGRPQDAPRALRDASRRLQERSGRLETAQERSGRPQDDSHRRSSFSKWSFLKSIFERPRGCCRSLNIKPTWIWGSTSPKVGVQKRIRRTCSIPLSSIRQASGRLAPCMAMHGSTLVYTCIYIYIYTSICVACHGVYGAPRSFSTPFAQSLVRRRCLPAPAA